MTRSARLQDDWVRRTRQLFPELTPALDRVGIVDTATYLEGEPRLPIRIRSEMGRIRNDLTLISACEVRDQVRATPPWVSPLPFSKIRVPSRIRTALEPFGVTRVEDLCPYGDRDLLQTFGLTRASLRTLSLALLVASRTPPPRPVRSETPPDRLHDLLTGAPEAALAAPISLLTYLRPRPLLALRELGVLTLRDLSGLTERRLLSMPGFGPGSVEDLIRSVQGLISGKQGADPEPGVPA